MLVRFEVSTTTGSRLIGNRLLDIWHDECGLWLTLRKIVFHFQFVRR